MSYSYIIGNIQNQREFRQPNSISEIIGRIRQVAASVDDSAATVCCVTWGRAPGRNLLCKIALFNTYTAHRAKKKKCAGNAFTIEIQEAFKKCWAHSPLQQPHALILYCHSPGVATVARRLRFDVHYDDDDNNENA